MKKGLMVFALLVLLVAGGIWYVLSGAGDFIRAQIEQQGSKYLGTPVSLMKVDLALTEGRMTISDLKVKNPQGFSDEDAFAVNGITFDLGEALTEPYVVQTININAPAFLYELDAAGKGNLMALKNNLATNLPKTEQQPASKNDGAANPLVIVDNITVSNVRVRLNFEQLPTGDLSVDTKAYEVTLPTFNAGPFGQPNGMPADQMGLAVVDAMLDQVITAAKSEVKKRLADQTKKKLNEKLDEQKDRLLEKASGKLKGLFSKDQG